MESRAADRDRSPQISNTTIGVYDFGSKAGKMFAVVLYGAILTLFLAPLFLMATTSFKEPNEVFATPVQWLPSSLDPFNFINAWTRFDFNRYVFNSFFVSVSVTVLHVTLACLAGFGLAKYRFVGRNFLMVAVLLTIMLPIEVIMVPLYLVARNLDWLNSYQGLIFPAVADGFGVFLMAQFIRQIPNSLIESARIDGASDLRILFRVVLPLCWPAVATLTIFIWRETWDDFVWPFIMISDESYRTIPLGIGLFQQNYVTNYGELMAISLLATIPLALVFLFFQRAFVRGITLSGMKG